MSLLVSVCDISWWMAAIAMVVPAILAGLLAHTLAKEKNESHRKKIKQLQAELKKCYEEKQIIKTKLVSPAVKFSDHPIDSPQATKKVNKKKSQVS